MRASEKAACLCAITPTRKSLTLYNDALAVFLIWLLMIVSKDDQICVMRYLIYASKIPKMSKIKTITLKKNNLKDQNSIEGRDVQHITHYQGDFLQPSLNVLSVFQILIGILW